MFIVVGHNECRYCELAKQVIFEANEMLVFFDVRDPYYTPLRQFLTAIHLTTVPQIWHDGQYIGGYEDLQDYLTNYSFKTW